MHSIDVQYFTHNWCLQVFKRILIYSDWETTGVNGMDGLIFTA